LSPDLGEEYPYITELVEPKPIGVDSCRAYQREDNRGQDSDRD